MEGVMETNIDGERVPFECCVKVRNAYKWYSSKAPILNGLNMTVPKGVIYGLLGPSGCGKTTLLRALVGRLKLDFGTIRLNVNRKCDLGFMPQSLSLYPTMTINENLILFGYLFSMTKNEVLIRAAELISFLALPSGDRLVNTLSSGQQRRVSMAIAFIHNPKILFLDEPTVGLDLHLVESVWSQLLQYVSTGKTIIITTHYIQEANRAHRIGLMRNGVLLAEEHPEELVQKYNSNNLEEIFLLLSQEQGHHTTITKLNKDECQQKIQPVCINFQETGKYFSVQKLKSVIYKELTTLKRNYGYIIMVFILPILQICIFNTVYGHEPDHLSIAIVNNEIPLNRCNFSINRGCFLDENSKTFLSCIFLDILRNKTYEMKEYNNMTTAIQAVNTNTVWAALYFPKNYTLCRIHVENEGTYATTEDLDGSSVHVWLGSSGKYIESFVKKDLSVTVADHLKIAYKNCELNPTLADNIRFEEPLNSFGVTKAAALASLTPASLCVFVFALAMIGANTNITEERINGTLERMLTAGLLLKEYIVGFMITQIVLHCLRVPLIMYFIYVIFNNPNQGNLIITFCLMLLVGLIGILLGIMNTVSYDSFSAVTLATDGMMFLISISTGLMWPLEGQHKILKFFNKVNPIVHAIEATEAITVRNLSFLHVKVWKGFAVNSLWSAFIIMIIFLLTKYKPNLWVN